MTGHDYEEMARLSALAVEAERRRAGLPNEPREAMAREGASAQGVRPVTGVLLFCGSALIVIGVFSLLWAAGVLS